MVELDVITMSCVNKSVDALKFCQDEHVYSEQRKKPK